MLLYCTKQIGVCNLKTVRGFNQYTLLLNDKGTKHKRPTLQFSLLQYQEPSKFEGGRGGQMTDLIVR